MMVTLGTDAHKRSHTMVAIDDVGAEIASVTVAATPEGHLRLVKWAARWEQRRWAIEDCRQLSRRLEADLLRIGDQVVRVPPKLMAGVRRSARTRGKSDPIDALAVARAALREPDLPVAQLDGPSREVRLLVDYRCVERSPPAQKATTAQATTPTPATAAGTRQTPHGSGSSTVAAPTGD